MSRGRRYDFTALEGFADERIGYAASLLDEESERLYDLIAGLSKAMLCFVPEGTNLSIARLVRHMIWAEMSWVSRISGNTPPSALSSALEGTSLADFAHPPRDASGASELIELGRRMRDEHSFPALRRLPDAAGPGGAAAPGSASARFDAPRGPKSVQEVLSHIIWHWTYHTGQVGLTRLLAGDDYQWSFHPNTLTDT